LWDAIGVVEAAPTEFNEAAERAEASARFKVAYPDLANCLDVDADVARFYNGYLSGFVAKAREAGR